MSELVRVQTGPSDTWEVIVGVPLDEWIAATTQDQLADLLARRDNPPPPETLSEHQNATGHSSTVDIDDLRTGHVLTMCEHCAAMFAPEPSRA